MTTCPGTLGGWFCEREVGHVGRCVEWHGEGDGHWVFDSSWIAPQGQWNDTPWEDVYP